MAENQRAVSPTILVAGGIALVIAIAYAAWVFVFTDDVSIGVNGEVVIDAPSGMPSEQPTGEVPIGSIETPVTEEGEGQTEPSAGEEPASALPETFEVYTLRNPFASLIRERSDQNELFPGRTDIPSGGVQTTDGITGGTGSPTQPVQSQAPNPYTPGQPTPQPGQSTAPGSTPAGSGNTGTSSSVGTTVGGQIEVGSTRIRLQDVPSPDRAIVTVNGVDYNPAVGEPFAEKFKLLSVDTTDARKCATMLFGDSRFNLCAGQVIDK